MLCFRLNRLLPSEREVLAAMQLLNGFSPMTIQRRQPADDGKFRNRYAVLVPGGRRPDRLLAQMKTQIPSAQWTLIDLDADGYEIPVAPDGKPLERQS
jgi:hypothetical protein